jgi:hypothetical protein
LPFTAIYTLAPLDEVEESEIRAVVEITDDFLRVIFERFFRTRPNARLISIETLLMNFQTSAKIAVRQSRDTTTVTIEYVTTGRAAGNVPSFNDWLELIEAALESEVYLRELRSNSELTIFSTIVSVNVQFIRATPPPTAIVQIAPSAPV